MTSSVKSHQCSLRERSVSVPLLSTRSRRHQRSGLEGLTCARDGPRVRRVGTLARERGEARGWRRPSFAWQSEPGVEAEQGAQKASALWHSADMLEAGTLAMAVQVTETAAGSLGRAASSRKAGGQQQLPTASAVTQLRRAGRTTSAPTLVLVPVTCVRSAPTTRGPALHSPGKQARQKQGASRRSR